MIELNFTASPDEDVLGGWKFYFDTITLGTALANNIVLNDPLVGPKGVKIEVGKKGIWVETILSSHHYANGKKIRGRKLQQKGDKIGIGGTIFTIVSFEKNSREEVDFYSPYQQIEQKDARKKKVIDAIEWEIEQLEKIIE